MNSMIVRSFLKHCWNNTGDLMDLEVLLSTCAPLPPKSKSRQDDWQFHGHRQLMATEKLINRFKKTGTSERGQGGVP